MVEDPQPRSGVMRGSSSDECIVNISASSTE